MAVKLPAIEQWSPEVADAIALDNKLAADEKAVSAEAHRLNALNGRDDNRATRAAMIAAGQTVEPVSSVKAQLDEAITRLGDIELARELHSDKLWKIRRREEIRFCKEVAKPHYDASAAKFAEHLAGIYGCLVDMDRLVSDLKSQGVGFYPIVGNLETDEVFGSPFYPGSNIVVLLRECVKFDHLSTLPKGLK